MRTKLYNDDKYDISTKKDILEELEEMKRFLKSEQESKISAIQWAINIHLIESEEE